MNELEETIEEIPGRLLGVAAAANERERNRARFEMAIAEAVQLGASLREVARVAGVSYETVRQIASAYESDEEHRMREELYARDAEAEATRPARREALERRVTVERWESGWIVASLDGEAYCRTDDGGRGLFRRHRDGTWAQVMGTLQYGPVTESQLRRDVIDGLL